MQHCGRGLNVAAAAGVALGAAALGVAALGVAAAAVGCHAGAGSPR